MPRFCFAFILSLGTRDLLLRLHACVCTHARTRARFPLTFENAARSRKGDAAGAASALEREFSDLQAAFERERVAEAVPREQELEMEVAAERAVTEEQRPALMRAQEALIERKRLLRRQVEAAVPTRACVLACVQAPARSLAFLLCFLFVVVLWYCGKARCLYLLTNCTLFSSILCLPRSTHRRSG
jgi:hypothetical protein